MLYHKLLVALFAIPFVTAQEAQGAPSDAAAQTDAGAAPAAETTPAADPAAGSAPAPAPSTTTRTGGSIGGNTENTGHGFQNTTGDWVAANFTVPNTETYWVNEAENTAIWTPYQQAVNLVIFNSNTSLLTEQRTVAENIPAGTGTWTGMISGFATGNNYILVLALTNDPTRKIGQTRGFWIKRNGTLPAPLPEGAGQTMSGGGVAASGTAIPSAPASSAGTAAGTGASSPAASGSSGAGKIVASLGAVVGAGALVMTLF
ncbi:hypothetical protein CC85DRAFT_288441 [Cutaneotrichosporon oleaginosum]|uniref:WW domain-containing protein n=1 Tax=Cutaneotrichosporon oleaginosum TaxID=879819 RepID=A0A0J1AW67_9TREE|nr:uncharacterized protein CC85DRAFT_288441 [Cutaneotrichosporon oleaginosum]KLT39524.1 hypothetical protein CC85DRAFT_288441 [Cutaneotrichosporon oleaginosum]TXT07077.1 hypothetical protein COLE_06408 [Cutaneotrichosporon oleaginosum]